MLDGEVAGGLFAPHLDDAGRIGIRSASGLLIAEDGRNFSRLPTAPYATNDPNLVTGVAEYLAFGGGTFVLPSRAAGSATVQASPEGTVALAAAGEPAPIGGTWGTSDYVFSDVNSQGTTVFYADVRFDDPTPSSTSGLFIADDAGVRPLVLPGQSFGNREIGAPLSPAINDRGQVAFFNSTFSASSEGYYLLDGDAVRPILTGNTVTAGGVLLPRIVDGVLGPLSGGPSLNNRGEVAAFSELNVVGIVIGGGERADNVADIIFENGSSLADGRQVDLASLVNFDRPTVAPPLNDVGQVVFQGSFRGTSSNGLFVDSAEQDLTLIVESGMAVPGGRPGVFGSFAEPLVSINDVFDGGDRSGSSSIVRGPFAINNSGQVAFQADILGGDAPLDFNNPVFRSGLFFWDADLGLHTIIAPGDIVDGEIVSLVSFEGSDAFGGNGDDGFNDAGQVAFRYTTTNNNSYLGVWQIPEPASASVVAFTSLILLRRRR